MPVPRTQRIRDPLHNLVEFATGSDELEHVLWLVIQTRPFQRLRRVKQLGFSELVYPGATHSRFAHSIGVFFIARLLMDIIRRQVTRPEDSKIRRALAASLVHDLGHGPFSHAFESIGRRFGLKMAEHEHVSDVLIRDSEVTPVLNQLGRGFADDVADMIQGTGINSVYRAIVTSQFDADRLDYMQRDRLMTGSQHAGIDLVWLLANLEIAKLPYGVDQEQVGEVETFVLGPKAIHAADAFVLGLFQLYPTVYFHKATRSAEKMFSELIARVVELSRGGIPESTGLPSTHPLLLFAREPDSLEIAQSLDDTVVWGALAMMMSASDALISTMSRRLRDRDLYKCVDVRTQVEHHQDPTGTHDEAKTAVVDRTCASIEEKLIDWDKGHRYGMPRILIDRGARSPYQSIDKSKGPLDRINIRTPDNQLVDLAQRSSPVAALKTFKFFRAYVDNSDTEARTAVRTIVEGELHT